MTNPLQFARKLAAFEEAIRCQQCSDFSIRDCLRALLDQLVDVEEALTATEIVTIIDHAIDIYDDAERRAENGFSEESRQLATRYEEAVRRHDLAITVECPYCGAAPNVDCRTRGPSGGSNPKGIHDHRDRYRAATDPQWKNHRE